MFGPATPGLPTKKPMTVGRAIKRGLAMMAIMAVMTLALFAFAAWLIHAMGPTGAVRAVHESMVAIRPYVVAGQIGVVGLIWWFWAPLVRWGKFAPPVEAAWLAARNRLALWAIGLIVLGVAMWSSAR
jgi:hypothetical protein